jgi:hypothetical protein
VAKNSGIYQSYDFSGGINVMRPPYLIGDNQLVQMTNCTFEVPGLITSRLGQWKYNFTEITDAVQVPWCSRVYDNDGTTKSTFVIAEVAAVDKMYVGDDSTGVFTEVTGGAALTKGGAYTSVVWKQQLFVTNGTESIQVWSSGTTKADIGGAPAPPEGKYLELHVERLFIAGNATYPSRLYWCETGDETDWPAVNYMDVGEDDGGVIVGIAKLGQTLMIAKDNGWYRLWGNSTDTWELKPVLGLPGCIAPRSLVKAIGGLIWFASEGLYYYDGANMKDLSSESVRPIAKDILGADLQLVCGIYYDAKYLLSYPANEAYNNTIVVYDFRTGGWYKLTNWKLSSFMWWSGGNDNGELYGGSASDGFLHKLFFGYTDNGVAIPVTIETKHIDGGSPGNVKQWNNIILHAITDEAGADIVVTPYFQVDQPQQSFTITAASVNVWGVVIWGAFTWGGGGIQRTRSRNVNPSKSTTMGLKLVWSGSTSQMNFRGFSVEFDILTTKR